MRAPHESAQERATAAIRAADPDDPGIPSMETIVVGLAESICRAAGLLATRQSQQRKGFPILSRRSRRSWNEIDKIGAAMVPRAGTLWVYRNDDWRVLGR